MIGSYSPTPWQRDGLYRKYFVFCIIFWICDFFGFFFGFLLDFWIFLCNFLDFSIQIVMISALCTQLHPVLYPKGFRTQTKLWIKISMQV